MSQYTEGQRKSFKSSSTAAANLRWVLSDTSTSPPTVELAGASALSHCINEDAILVSGDDFAGRLTNAQGTRKMVASEAITGGDSVYAAAGGKVAATGTVLEGIAMESAGANNDIIEVMPIHNADISTSGTGTTAATFEADSDLGKPRAALGSQTGGTGNYKAVIRPPSTLGADRVFTLVGDANTNLVGDDTAQTLSNKTIAGAILTGNVKLGQTVTPVAAAGSTVADAAALPATTLAHITSDSAAKGVKFAAATAATVKIVINNSSTAAELYANDGGTVNGLSADASVVIPASKGVLAVCIGADTWIVFDLPAKASAS